MMEVSVEQPQKECLNCIIGSQVTAIELDGEEFPTCSSCIGKSKLPMGRINLAFKKRKKRKKWYWWLKEEKIGNQNST